MAARVSDPWPSGHGGSWRLRPHRVSRARSESSRRGQRHKVQPRSPRSRKSSQVSWCGRQAVSRAGSRQPPRQSAREKRSGERQVNQAGPCITRRGRGAERRHGHQRGADRKGERHPGGRNERGTTRKPPPIPKKPDSSPTLRPAPSKGGSIRRADVRVSRTVKSPTAPRRRSMAIPIAIITRPNSTSKFWPFTALATIEPP